MHAQRVREAGGSEYCGWSGDYIPVLGSSDANRGKCDTHHGTQADYHRDDGLAVISCLGRWQRRAVSVRDERQWVQVLCETAGQRSSRHHCLFDWKRQNGRSASSQ